MKVRYKKPYQYKKKTVIEDGEGGKYATYGDPIPINCYIYPASGTVQAEMYGDRLAYILNVLYDEAEPIAEGDVIIYNGANYKVISIKQYTEHKLIEIEKEL